MLPNSTVASASPGVPGGGWRHPAAQHGVDARHQFAGTEGFGQVVVGAHFQTDDAVDLVALGGEHDDGDLVLLATQPPADRQAILAGHHQVEHDQIVEFAGERLVHRGGAVDGLDGEALLAEVALQQLSQAQVVVDDEDLGGSGGWLGHGMEC